MNDAAVTLGCALGDIVRAVDKQDVQLAPGQFTGNARSDAPSAHNHNVPQSIRRRLLTGGEALAAGKASLFDCLWGAIGLEQVVAGLDVSPHAGNVTAGG